MTVESYHAIAIVSKSRAPFSTNGRQNQNKSLLVHVIFPLLRVSEIASDPEWLIGCSLLL